MRFQYSTTDSSQNEFDSLPRIPLRLLRANRVIEALGLVDSGAPANVLPYEIVNAPLILGQANFFLEFDVCFYRSKLEFEIKPKSG